MMSPDDYIVGSPMPKMPLPDRYIDQGAQWNQFIGTVDKPRFMSVILTPYGVWRMELAFQYRIYDMKPHEAFDLLAEIWECGHLHVKIKDGLVKLMIEQGRMCIDSWYSKQILNLQSPEHAEGLQEEIRNNMCLDEPLRENLLLNLDTFKAEL